MLPPKAFYKLAYLDYLLRVKADGRLVKDDDLRVSEQCLRYADTLAVALREIADEPVRHAGDLRDLHHLRDLPPDIDLGDALCLGDELQVLPWRAVDVQRRLLREVADELFGLVRVLKDIVPVDAHVTGGGGKAAGHDVHGRGLARAVRAEKAVYAPVLYREGQIRHSCVFTVELCQMLYFYQKESAPLHGFRQGEIVGLKS